MAKNYRKLPVNTQHNPEDPRLMVLEFNLPKNINVNPDWGLHSEHLVYSFERPYSLVSPVLCPHRLSHLSYIRTFANDIKKLI